MEAPIFPAHLPQTLPLPPVLQLVRLAPAIAIVSVSTVHHAMSIIGEVNIVTEIGTGLVGNTSQLLFQLDYQ